MGVDTGGDAFALAQEQYGQPVEGSMQIGIAGLVERAEAQAKRYEEAIERQKQMLGTQAQKISEARLLLEEMSGLSDGSYPLVEQALRVLKGE